MSIPISTIEEKRRSLGFLETLPNPSQTVLDMIAEFRAEIAAHEWNQTHADGPRRTREEFAKH